MQWEIMQLLCCTAAVNWKQSRPINIGSKRSCQIIIMHVSMGHYNYTQSYRSSSHKVVPFSLYSSPPHHRSAQARRTGCIASLILHIPLILVNSRRHIHRIEFDIIIAFAALYAQSEPADSWKRALFTQLSHCKGARLARFHC